VGLGSRVSLNNIVEVRATNRWLCLGLTVAVQSDTLGACASVPDISAAQKHRRNIRILRRRHKHTELAQEGAGFRTFCRHRTRHTDFYSLRPDPGFQELIQAKKDSPFYYTQFSNLEPYSGLVRRKVLGDRRKYCEYTARTLKKNIDPGGVVNP
jgi:hypothetical protein